LWRCADDESFICVASSKHALRYDEMSGKIYLQINKLGPGDEGEYTCIGMSNFMSHFYLKSQMIFNWIICVLCLTLALNNFRINIPCLT
jgi:hypothetical protein